MFATRSFSQCIDLNGELGMRWLLDCVLLPLHDVNFSLSLTADIQLHSFAPCQERTFKKNATRCLVRSFKGLFY